MSPTPDELTKAFIDGMGQSYDNVVDNMRKYLREDVEWHTGTALRHGLDDAIAHMSEAKDVGISHWDADILRQASNGNVVFQERVDHIYRLDGSKLADTYVNAVFEIDGDQIAKWRDYYNPDELRALMAAEG